MKGFTLFFCYQAPPDASLRSLAAVALLRCGGDLAFERIDNEISSLDQNIQSGALITGNLMPQLGLIVFIMQRANSSEGEWFEGWPRVEPHAQGEQKSSPQRRDERKLGSRDWEFFTCDWFLMFSFGCV